MKIRKSNIMAKFTVEYTIHVGDKVSFIGHGVTASGIMYEEVQMGTVQDISQLPDVFVEGFRNSAFGRHDVV